MNEHRLVFWQKYLCIKIQLNANIYEQLLSFIYTALYFGLITASHPQAAVTNIHRGNSCSGHKIIKMGITVLNLQNYYSEFLLFTSSVRLSPVLFIDSKVAV